MNEDFDYEFFTTLFDEEGTPVKVLKNRIAKEDESNTSSFKTYDTKYGHCGLCGNLSCRGTCFK